MDPTLIISVASLIGSIAALSVSIFRNRLTKKQMMLSSTISVINWLEEVRSQRHVLYKIKAKKKDFKDWTLEEKDAANQVTRKFDILGVLEKCGYVDKEFVERFWAIAVNEVWEICKEWVENERSLRGENHLWEFEQLVKRFNYPRLNHPDKQLTSKLKFNNSKIQRDFK